MTHSNNGSCQKCLAIFNQYPGFYKSLQDWFFSVQEKFPSFHIACAGRGQVDQEAAFARGASKAHWLQSSHNFNAAIDTWFQVNGQYRLDSNLYDQIVGLIDPTIDWYGAAGAVFPERPHFEVKGWKAMADGGQIFPVE